MRSDSRASGTDVYKRQSLPLSELLGATVYDPSGAAGKVREVTVAPQEDRDRIATFIVKTKSGNRVLPYSAVTSIDANIHTSTYASDWPAANGSEGQFLLERDLLDQQVIDINGRKVVRVNDVDLGVEETKSNGTPHALSLIHISPSMDDLSAQFSMNAPGDVANKTYGYSNYLYFNPIAGGNSVSNVVYDIYFYIDNPDAPQALEFDVNQGYTDTTGSGDPLRYTWGSECNFKGETPGMWDIWDDANSVWRESSVPCNPFPAATWNHITWNLHLSLIHI